MRTTEVPGTARRRRGGSPAPGGGRALRWAAALTGAEDGRWPDITDHLTMLPMPIGSFVALSRPPRRTG